MTTQKLLDQSGLTEGVVNLRLHEYVPEMGDQLVQVLEVVRVPRIQYQIFE